VHSEYSAKYGYTLLKAMEKELGGLGEKGVRQATLYMIGMKLKPYEAMATLIRYALPAEMCELIFVVAISDEPSCSLPDTSMLGFQSSPPQTLR
jgi:hypothetical protein